MIKTSDGVLIEFDQHFIQSDCKHAYVLLHPHPLYGGNMDHKVIKGLFNRIKSDNQSVIRFNFRGTSKSTGAFDHGKGELLDLQAVLDHTMASLNVSLSHIVLIAYSFGSFVAYQYALKHAFKALIMIAPPITLYDFSNKNLQTAVHAFLASEDELIDFKDSLLWCQENPKHVTPYTVKANHYFTGSTHALFKALLPLLKNL